MGYPMDDVGSELIIAPLHEGPMAGHLPMTLRSGSSCRLEHIGQVLAMRLRAVTAEPDAWAELEVAFDLPLAGYDTLIHTATLPAGATAAMTAGVDGRDWEAVPCATAVSEGVRLTLRGPITRNGTAERLHGVRLRYTFPEPGEHLFIVSWIAIADDNLRSRIEQHPWPVDRQWTQQVNPDADWDSPRFRCGLLFSADELPALREKCRNASWSPRFQQVRERAEAAMAREPEDDLGLYQPWSDRRYSRDRHPARPYFHEAIDLCFTGLILQDAAMLRHAARYLMCMVHTRHWSCSEESHATGITWTQRCFIEEMTATAVALLTDWLDFALTDAGRQVADQALWDEGLSAIERDIMKFDYLHRCNQGPWFGRARILGGLVLEASWPHVDDYVERAMQKVVDGLAGYVLPDGGTDEGVGYLGMTMHTALGGLFAYGRSRGVDVRDLMPKPFETLERYLCAMSASQPGRVLLAADNSCDRILGDGIAMLATLYPGQAYEGMLGGLMSPEPDTYYRQFMQAGVFGLVFGPDTMRAPRTLVPTFDCLPHIGQATSLRTDEGGRSLRVHVSGCRAAPGHTHFDQGALVVEADGEPIFIDRGIVRYDDARGLGMKQSCMHNVLTPVLDDGIFPDQALPRDHAIIPDARGDAERFTASVGLAAVWPSLAEAYERRIDSPDPQTIIIHDTGRWSAPYACAFHLHALSPFVIDGDSVVLKHNGIRFRLDAPWAVHRRNCETGIDFAYRPVWRLTLSTDPIESFNLTTTITRLDVG